MLMMNRGHVEMALKLILDFDTYMRPGESVDLKVKNLIRPVKGAGPQYQWFSIVVRDFDDKQPDKVGIYDNSIPLNTPGRVWIGESLHALAKTRTNKESLLFSFSPEEYRQELAAVSIALGLKPLHPYQLRHGGAAEDLNSGVRDHSGVKARGRWQTDGSVRCYTKVGKVQQLMNLLSPKGMAYCQWSLRNLEKAFKGQVRPKTF